MDHEQNIKVIGNRIKEIRKTLGYFQDDFAKTLTVSTPTLSDVENGKTKPGFDILYNLTIIHQVNPDYVFRGTGELFIPKKEESDHLKKTEMPSSQSFDLNSFKEFAIDVKELLDLMLKSRLFLGHMVNMGKEYIYRNTDIIRTDIHVTQNNISINKEFENSK